MRSLYLFLTIVFAGCASINNEEVNFRKVSIEESKDLTIENQFFSDELSTIHLKAFEKRAMEKLKDFADYLEIIADSSYEDTFRQLAMSQARNLFIEYSEIRLKDEEYNKRIDHFLKEMKEMQGSNKVKINEIGIEVSLNESIGSLYEGLLTFNFSLNTKNEPELGSPQKRNMEFFLMKTQKAFGPNQKLVWEVFLGYIY